MAEPVESTSRYDLPHVTGRDRCGPCEGFGCYPVKAADCGAHERLAWEAAEREDPSDDGWHFIRCPSCGGTGVRR